MENRQLSAHVAGALFPAAMVASLVGAALVAAALTPVSIRSFVSSSVGAATLTLLFGMGYLLTIGEYEVAATVAQDPSIPHVKIDGVTYHTEPIGPGLTLDQPWCISKLAELLALLRDGKISPVVAARTPLSEASLAHELLEQAEYGGKVVLVTE